jgi:methylmalonyl-CoA mutase
MNLTLVPFSLTRWFACGYMKRYGAARNASASDSLRLLQATARNRLGAFERFVEAVKYSSLGQLSCALHDGECRWNI